MLRRFALVLSFLSLALIAAITISCGSSSSTTPPGCTGGPYNVVGDWSGPVSSGSSSSTLSGTINSAGAAVFFDSLADIVVAPAITGTCSFSGTLTAYESVENGGPQTVPSTVTGNVTATMISGSDTVNGVTTTITLSPVTGSVSALSGITVADVEGQVVDSLLLTLGGTASSITFTGTDAAGCTFNGTFTEEGAANIYDVTFNVAGTGCTASSYTGFGFESSSDLLTADNNATGTYLYGTLTSSTNPFVVEIIPSGGRIDHSARQLRGVGPFNLFGMGRSRRR